MSTPNQTSRFIVSIVGVFAILLIAIISFVAYQFLSKEKISGKVLIVQRDANVKKLALIKIYAVRDADVIRWKKDLNERLRLAVESIHRFQKESAAAEAEIKEIGEKRVANSNECTTRTEEVTELARKIWLIDRNSQILRKRFNQLITSEGIPRGHEIADLTKNGNWQDAYHLLSEASLPEAQRINRLAVSEFNKELLSHTHKTRLKVTNMRDALESIIPPPTVQSLPDHIEIRAHDVTDDTGSFSLNVHPGDYYIFAEGSRSVFSTTEHYFWAHPISVPSQESEKCLIGNLNLNGESTLKDDLWHELRQTIAEQKRAIQP
jgi:hypothetical protein